jgi:AGZA family xanthine/uracil permease-like MFS transporter
MQADDAMPAAGPAAADVTAPAPRAPAWREALAGVTTFMTMAYILVVNPAILSDAIFLEESGDLFAELVMATAIAAAIATLVMGIYARYPFALAPGMGLNAFFTYTVVIGLGIDWRIALFAVFVEGLIFIALTALDLRRVVVNAIPNTLKHATAAGIGLFIAYVGFSNAGIIAASPATKTTLGDIGDPSVAVALAGIFITGGLVARRIPGALLLGIAITAGIAIAAGVSEIPQEVFAVPQAPWDLVGQAFVGATMIAAIDWTDFLVVLFVLLFVDFFDTAGSLTGLGLRAGLMTPKGELPRANRAFLADAVGTTAGAALGTSTVTTYIESAAGIGAGGRTGLTAVFVALLFIASVFFIPLIQAVPPIATTPALVIVGVLMAGSLKAIDWDDAGEAIPAFLTVIVMPLSYSIAEGLAAGFIAYPIVKLFQGRAGEVSLAMWILAAIFILRFVAMGLGIG